MELNRLGLKSVKIKDIWDYLVLYKWSHSQDLMLSDIVSDILHIDNRRFGYYLRERKTRRGRSDKNERKQEEK